MNECICSLENVYYRHAYPIQLGDSQNVYNILQCKKLKERLIDATEQTHFEHRVTAKLIYCRDGKKRHLQNEAHKLHVKAFAYDNK